MIHTTRSPGCGDLTPVPPLRQEREGDATVAAPIETENGETKMLVHIWDEISDEWTQRDLPIESTCPIEINKHAQIGDTEDEDLDSDAPAGWEVKAHSWTKTPYSSILTIEAWTDRHKSVIVVIYNAQGTTD